MSVYSVAPLDLAGMRTVGIASRRSLVDARAFAKPVTREHAALVHALPHFLGASNLRALAASIVAANRSGRRVLVGVGAHVLKVGLSPVLIQLITDGFVNGIAMNGAGIVHDYEIALVGATSEDVAASLPEGSFGVTRETGDALNAAILAGAGEGIGLGECVGRMIAQLSTPTAPLSVLGACYRLRVPVTVHVAIGADVLHVHPSADGAAIGKTSLQDFRLFAALVAGLDGGGVYVNLGSAVILPEVFLKAVAAVRGLGMRLEGFTTANLDFIQHYRPLTNVVRRPTEGGGTGLAITGHHELLLPLLAAALYDERARVGAP